jgi:hypothetical protein
MAQMLTFASRNPGMTAVADATPAPGPKNRAPETFASLKAPKTLGFHRQPGSKRGFSTVFSTGVEILGNKPKPPRLGRL